MTIERVGRDEANERDQEVFLSLLTPNLDKLSRFATALTGDTEEARDLVSETILRAYENFHQVRAHEAFTSYLFTVARRLYIRQRKRRSIWTFFNREAEEKTYDSVPGLDAKLDCEALERALQMIPEKQREAVVLFEIAELTIEEIRDIQGGSLSGVKSRLVRGRKQLAKILGATERVAQIPSPMPKLAPVRSTNTQLAYFLKERL